MFFHDAFENCNFSIFYLKYFIFGIQHGPQLGVKNILILVIFASGVLGLRPKTVGGGVAVGIVNK